MVSVFLGKDYVVLPHIFYQDCVKQHACGSQKKRWLANYIHALDDKSNTDTGRTGFTNCEILTRSVNQLRDLRIPHILCCQDLQKQVCMDLGPKRSLSSTT